MPLGADPEANMKELRASAEIPGTRMYELRQKYDEAKFEKIVEAAGYDEARRHGWVETADA